MAKYVDGFVLVVPKNETPRAKARDFFSSLKAMLCP